LKRGPVIELPSTEAIPAGVVSSLLDLLDQPVVIADRAGRILQANVRGRQRLANHGFSVESGLNLFSDLLRINPNVIANRIESGEQRINSKFECCGGALQARVQWLAEMDWLVVLGHAAAIANRPLRRFTRAIHVRRIGREHS